ncbi:MAG: hypothetical protein H0U74_20655 [Bradymonadaceae bacterium]|nr:hypothetical protein [Lujinxingiaceae bacterium]
MKDPEFENYAPALATVVHVGEGWIRAFVVDAIPALGEALAIVGPHGQRVYAEVRRHSGHRLVEALLFDAPAWLSPGLPVERTHRAAAIALPEACDLVPGADTLVPHEPGENLALAAPRPSFAQLDGQRPPLNTGIEALDLLSPLVQRGTNLVIDTSTDTAAFDALARCTTAGADHDVALVVTTDGRALGLNARQVRVGQGAGQHLLALRLAMRWAIALRDRGQNVLFVAELPPVGSTPTKHTARAEQAVTVGFGEIVDLVGEALVSTHSAAVTVLLRLSLADPVGGLAEIIETLELGDIDAQIFVTNDGRFDPRRSHSRAQLPASRATQRSEALAILSLARKAEERSELFGDDELEPHELDALDQAQAWMAGLA